MAWFYGAGDCAPDSAYFTSPFSRQKGFGDRKEKRKGKKEFLHTVVKVACTKSRSASRLLGAKTKSKSYQKSSTAEARRWNSEPARKRNGGGGGEEEIPFVPTRHGGTAALRRQQSRAAGSWLEDRRRSPARGRRPVSAAPAIVTIAAANGPRRPGRGVIAELAQRATAAHFRRRQTAASPSDDVAGKSCSPLAKVPALLGLPDRTHASMIHAGCLPPPETFWCSVFDRFSIFSIKPELKTGPREELTQVLVSALNFVQLDTLCGQFNSCYKATNFQWPFWKAIFWAF